MFMSRWDWLKVIVLVLLPVNAWLGVFYYLHWQREKALREMYPKAFQETAITVHYSQRRLGIEEGKRLVYPFPFPAKLIGKPPPFGQGYPVVFLNISWIASLEVWEPTIQEILNASPYLHVVLLYRKSKTLSEGFKPIMGIVQAFNNPRLSVLYSEGEGGDSWMLNFFGSEQTGFLLFLCDGRGIVRHIEPYPKLKVSRYWKEEVSDWRPKLHQAVKKVLDKFFGEKRSR